jgi:hypothetical protein
MAWTSSCATMISRGGDGVTRYVGTVDLAQTEPEPPPFAVNLRPALPIAAFIQGTAETCIACDVGQWLAYRYRLRNPDAPPVVPSVYFLAYCARTLLGSQDDKKAGLNVTACVRAVDLWGWATEDEWPSTDPGALTAKPSAAAYAAALRRHGPTAVTYSVPSLAFLQSQLADGNPPLVAVTLYPSWGQAGPSGKVPMPGPNEKPGRHHSILATGYRPPDGTPGDGGGILFRNSVGGFGDAGHGQLPVAYLDSPDRCQGAWALPLA